MPEPSGGRARSRPGAGRGAVLNARRSYHCRVCSKRAGGKVETAQSFVGATNGDRPRTEEWRCVACGLVLITYADVLDADGLIIHVADSFLRGRGATVYGDVRSLDRADLLDELRAVLYHAYTTWQPQRGVRFRAFATWKLNTGIVEYLREQWGMDSRHAVPSPKAHAVALSLDAPARDEGGDGERPSAEGAVGGSGGDPADRDFDLIRALAG